MNPKIEKAQEHFGKLVEGQLQRVEEMKKEEGWIDYDELKPIVIGIVGGDGIGPYIVEEAQRVLDSLLEEELEKGKVKFKKIENLTIENRAKAMEAIPSDILEELKKCHVILKGPTRTPKKGGPWPNLESANVVMRRKLDLFANIRPVKVPEEGIDWVFFRENTEGAYILGSEGVNVGDDLAIDFKVTTKQGAQRIIRLAFEYAKENNRGRVSVVTKANVVKKGDGKFLDIGYKIAKEYPEIECEDWFIDIMAAKLVDPKRRKQFEVIVLPNLYGDIITDEAAEFQGGVGTAGSANVGKKYAMFEAIHGTAPRMVKEGRAKYADPSSILRATVMLLEHIGFPKKAEKLEKALDICGHYEKKIKITGRDTGAKGKEFANYVVATMEDSQLEEKWRSYQQ